MSASPENIEAAATRHRAIERALRSKHLNNTEIAREFGVTRRTVQRVKRAMIDAQGF